MKLTHKMRVAAYALTLGLAVMNFPLLGQSNGTSPAAGGSGAPSTPPSGNYPGSGSSPQPGVPPPPLAPSGLTPGSGQGGTTNTPPTGLTPGSGTSPQPAH